MVSIAPIYGDLGDGVLIVLPTLSWFVVEPYPSEKSWSERCESQLGWWFFPMEKYNSCSKPPTSIPGDPFLDDWILLVWYNLLISPMSVFLETSPFLFLGSPKAVIWKIWATSHAQSDALPSIVHRCSSNNTGWWFQRHKKGKSVKKYVKLPNTFFSRLHCLISWIPNGWRSKTWEANTLVILTQVQARPKTDTPNHSG